MRTEIIMCVVLALQASAFAAVPVTDDLIIHLEADSITGLSNGATVNSWADSATGDGVDGSLGSVSGEGSPTWHSGVLGGQPVVRFSDDVLSTASQFSLPNPGAGITVVAVFTGDSSGDQGERLAQIGDSDGGNGQVIGLDVSINRTNSDGGSGFRFNNGRSLAKSGNLLTTGFHRGVWQMAQGAQHQSTFFSVDGNPIVLDSINNPQNTTTLPTSGNIFSVGTGKVGGSWSASDAYTGDVAEILVYNALLTSAELEQISGYLDEKYLSNGPVTDGLIIHLKANSLSLNNNDPVTTWPDSATGDSTDGTVSAISGFGKPTYVADALNGWPVVRFVRPADVGSAPNSALQALESSIWSWDKTKGVSVFIVCTGGEDDVEQRAVAVGKSGGDDYKSFHCDVSANQSGVRYNNGYCLADSPFDEDEWHVSLRQIAQGGGYGSIRYDVNGTPFVETDSNATGKDINFDDSGNDITLGAGAQNDALINWYDGDIAEVMVYNKLLTPADVRKITTYLNEKYAVYEDDKGENFMVVAIPDTQGYPNHSNQPASKQLFIDEMAWIANKVKSKNIVFVSHEGDMVMNSNTTQYNRSLEAMEELLNRVPMGFVPGNHDYDNMGPSEGSTLWNTYYGYTTDFFRDKSWFGDVYLNGSDTSGMTTYQTFSTAGLDFLHIALECEPRDAVLTWAQGIVDAYPGWPTIVTTHSHLSASDGSYKSATSRDPYPRNNGQQVWNEFIKVNPQIFMVLCGHSFNPGPSQRRTDNNDAGYPVHQLLADYQACNSGSNLGNGGGWIRLLDFNPLANTVRVRTYTTIWNKYSSHSNFTDGSSWARNYGEFNYFNEGAGSLIPESHSKASEFTLPFIFGRQLPRPAEVYGDHIAGPLKSFLLNGTTVSGLTFDPSYTVNGDYDRVYYVDRVTDSSTRGLYSAELSDVFTSGRLQLGSYDSPYGCTADANGNVYVCYSAAAAVRKVTDPSGSSDYTDMIGNYRKTGDDDIQSVMMVPEGFGGDFDEGTDLIMIDSGLDGAGNESVVVLDAASTAAAPLYTVIWEDVSGYFTTDIRGCANALDGYCYMGERTIPEAKLSGTTRPHISRINSSGIMERIYLNMDITRDGATPICDDAIAVNPLDGSIWLASSADSANGDLYPRTIWRIDVANATSQGGNEYLASATQEIVNAYINVGVNGMTWSPDGKRLAIICADTGKIYVYRAAN